MVKITRTLFVLTLAISVAGGLLIVAAQILSILFGSAPVSETLNTAVKPWIVGTSAVCAMLSFVLMYLRGGGETS